MPLLVGLLGVLLLLVVVLYEIETQETYPC